jgi:hypothetical protein
MMPKLLREYTFREQNSSSDGMIATQWEAAIMQLQGELKGRTPGTMTGLTDLFTHLSHVEHSPNIVEKMQDPDRTQAIAFVTSLLDTYPHLPQQIKDDIIAYVKMPCQDTVDVIKQHAANEVQRIWDVLGIC